MLKPEIRDMIRNDFLINGKSISEVLNDYGIGKTLAYQLKAEAEIIRAPRSFISSENYSIKGDIIGVIGDTHEPFSREHYYDFCYEMFKKEGVTKVVHIGDLVDNHSFSRFANEPDALDGVSEFEMALNNVQKVKHMFKEWDFTWIKGNHDSIPQRQIATLGLPKFLLKSLPELFDVKEWDVATSKIIDNVMYTHGLGCMSTLLTAQRIRRSLVCGHSHSKCDIQSHAGWDDLVFGFHVGSGVDDKAYAFRYGKDTVLKSVISCGTIGYGVNPKIHYMPL